MLRKLGLFTASAVAIFTLANAASATPATAQSVTAEAPASHRVNGTSGADALIRLVAARDHITYAQAKEKLDYFFAKLAADRLAGTYANGVYVHPNYNVQRWYGAALSAGWKPSEWRKLSCIINRESSGDPAAYRHKGTDRSNGLTQINMKAHWRDFVRKYKSESAAFNPYTNLRYARYLYSVAGWSPWKTKYKPC